MTDKNTAGVDLDSLARYGVEQDGVGYMRNRPDGEYVKLADVHELLARRAEPSVVADYEFKRFHQQLCERFGYVHDERDWKRDQLSLIEHIARRAALASPAVSQMDGTSQSYKSGRQLYEEWVSDVGGPDFDELPESTKVHWNKQALRAAQQAGAGYCADCNSWGSEHRDGCKRRPERFTPAATTASASIEPFADWLAREMPSGTVINDPAWWAPRILRAALARAPLPAQGDAK
jgi:hypothetical protein